MVIAIDAHPLIGPIIFWDLIYHYQLVDPDCILCAGLILPCRSFRQSPQHCIEWLSAYLVRWLPCTSITALLQTVTPTLHRMAFCLSSKVVALHFNNSTAKACLCNQGGTVSPFLSRLACQILSLTIKHGIALIPAYIPTHLNVEAN